MLSSSCDRAETSPTRRGFGKGEGGEGNLHKRVYQEQKIAKGIAEVEYVTQKDAIAKCNNTLKSCLGLG